MFSKSAYLDFSKAALRFQLLNNSGHKRKKTIKSYSGNNTSYIKYNFLYKNIAPISYSLCLYNGDINYEYLAPNINIRHSDQDWDCFPVYSQGLDKLSYYHHSGCD